MLSLCPRFIANNIPSSFGQESNYTVFGDSDDPNLFYLLPEFPTFHQLDSKTPSPSFSMIWYYGSDKKGGVCTFTVALPLPDTGNPKVRERLVAAIRQDTKATERAQGLFDMAKANAAGNNAEAEAKREYLGLTVDQAKNYYAQFKKDGDYTQFLPNDTSLKFQAVPYTNGKVTVKGFGGDDAFQKWQNSGADDAKFSQDYQATPSKLNNNTAVVSFDLTNLGVNLFWQALGGPDFSADSSKVKATGFDSTLAPSVVAVQYTVEFEAMLPAAKAIVTLKQRTVARLLKETRTGMNTWGEEKSWQDVVGKQYQQYIDQSLEVKLPPFLNNENDKKIIRETLDAWAQAQLVDMLKAQLPDVKLSDLGTSASDPMQKIEAIQDQSRTYELSQSIKNTASPNGQLTRISDIVSKDKLSAFFQLIDLNKVPYIDVTVIVEPPNARVFEDLSISSVVVTQINYASKPLRDKKTKENVSVLTFDAKNPTGRNSSAPSAKPTPSASTTATR